MKELKEFSSEEEYVPRSIQYIVVHCSATRANIPFTEEQLLKCHLQRGFKCIGYHFYITRDGELHHCRPVSEPGAHVRGFNRHSIGICYEGGLDENGYPADTRTQAQRFTLLDLLTILRHQYPKAQILGHYQLSASISTTFDLISFSVIKPVLVLTVEKNMQNYKKYQRSSQTVDIVENLHQSLS